MLKRKIINKLAEWKEETSNKALLIKPLNMIQSLFSDKINRRIVMSCNNLETADGVIYLPFYMSMFI